MARKTAIIETKNVSQSCYRSVDELKSMGHRNWGNYTIRQEQKIIVNDMAEVTGANNEMRTTE